MKLTYEGLKKRADWERASVTLPSYDINAVKEKTAASPTWIHFGAGNIARGFIASLAQDLLQSGETDTGMIAADTFDFGILDQIYAPHDCLSLVVRMHPDGTLDKEIVASMVEGLKVGASCPADLARAEEIFRSPTLQMVSFTITEKGYSLKNLKGEYTPSAEADFSGGPEHCTHAMSLVCSLLLKRFLSGAMPLALVSMDNCSRNGEKLRNAVLTVAKKWKERGFVVDDFVSWLSDESKVSFPWTMIDKITPRPAPAVEEALRKAGVEDMSPITTDKGTYIAPFVNTEVPQYLVIEDRFPAGRPPLEKAGVYMTDRETVNKTERMKVTTCLNPLHTALAVYGCLLGYTSIASEMADADLSALAERIGREEGMPVVVHPGILNPADFLEEVLKERLPNPFIPDTPQRIATDTSQKVGIRYGETIKAYANSETLHLSNLTYIPLAIAGWLRYLLAVDDEGKPFSASDDPQLSSLQEALKDVKVGRPESLDGHLEPILRNAELFGSDLVSLGLGEKITAMVQRMLKGPGAVRETLHSYLSLR